MRNLCFTLLLGALAWTNGYAQVPREITRGLLEDYSREIFDHNAEGFMSPLVIVANIGANDAFYNSAYVPREHALYVDVSVRTMTAFVLDEERSFTAILPLAQKNYKDAPPEEQLRGFYLNTFKSLLQDAADAGELETVVETATVFGGEGKGFIIPKQYLQENASAILDSAVLAGLPSQLALTPGTNQDMVIAAVPQITVGSYYSTEMLVRYVPPVVFDENIGKFSFFGIAVKHAFTNWFFRPLFDASIQVGFQHSNITNEVGVTRAKLEASTDLFAVNLHASRRFRWIEPYAGFSFETLNSDGSYTFTLPQNIKDEIGYDINPQTVPVTLSDSAVKGTVGVTAHLGPMQIFASAGIAKHLIFSGGLAYRFNP